ncbi:MAG: peptidylprolyl isomerase [Steroidobacteraceae bacterium]
MTIDENQLAVPEPLSAPVRHSKLRKLLREPLVHFITAGFVVFALYGGLKRSSPEDQPQRIEINADDVRRIEISWQARWQRLPTPDELRNLIDEQVKEEILYREALALGLEKEDMIIKRRLAQKMDFLAEDVANLREPAPGELESWFAKNRDQFAPPPLVTFHHLFFASDKRGTSAEADAQRALASTRGKDASGGDPFMFQSAYTVQTPEQVVRFFGSKFAARIFREQPGGWRGPIESGYGWHLVWIDALTPAEPPSLESVAEQAKSEWVSEQRAQAKQATFDAIRARYEVVVTAEPPSAGKIAALAGTR